MAKVVTGNVEKIGNRGKAWDVYVSGNRYGAGFSKPDFEVGDKVTFEVVDVEWKGKSYENIDTDTVEVVTKAADNQPEAKSAAPVAAAQDAKPSQSYWDAKDRKITWLACQKDAVSLIPVLIANEALTIPKTKGKAYGVIMDTVKAITADLFETVVSGAFDAENVDADVPQ